MLVIDVDVEARKIHLDVSADGWVPGTHTGRKGKTWNEGRISTTAMPLMFWVPKHDGTTFRVSYYLAIQPPSITMSVPVIKPACSEQR